ncbi:MAG TPA: putative Ig domain-containing protein, partial [Candidatus Ozemobacteraceae bacterium]|nr:putative Ig domain-containing protein [Candidatus Ozemobacteraceae bacterium]
VVLVLNGCGGGGGAMKTEAVPFSGLQLDSSLDGSAATPSPASGSTDSPQAQPAQTATNNSLIFMVPGDLFAPISSYTSIQLLAANGSRPYVFSATGLPAGFALDSTTGIISGISAEPATTVATFTVTDASGSTRIAASLFMVAPFMRLSSLPEMNLTSGMPVCSLFAVPLEGTPPFTFTTDGMPRGLNLAVCDQKTALLTGVPSREGSYTIRLSVRDAAGAVATAVTDISVSRNGFWVEVGVSFIHLGDTYDQQICKAQGGMPVMGLTGAKMYDYSVSGLPPGISMFDNESVTGYGSSQRGTLVTGTATATGTYLISASATDAEGNTAAGMGLIQVDSE